jgi:ketosteroid isomerase-like protein
MTTNTKTETTTDPKIAAVQRLYDAFFAGDVDAFVADVSDDVDWAAEAGSTSAPWYGPRDKQGARRFFSDIGTNVEVASFEQLSYAANETDVFVAVRWSFTVRATGKQATMHMQHWFRFDQGKIVFFRGSEDTEQTAAAFAPEP